MDIDERVRRYAADALGESCAGGITSVARFDAGDRHAVFRVTCVDAHGRACDVVVRVSTRDDGVERARAEREAAVLEKLRGVGAPRLFDHRNEGPWFDTPAMCMQFIEGEPRELASAPREDVAALGAVVASVHNLPVDDLADQLPGPRTTAAYVEEWIERIESYLPAFRDPLPPSVHARLERARAGATLILERALRPKNPDTDAPLVLLHGDVGPGNILWSERPVLIDWEYARLGDPADEVAYIFAQHGLAPSHRAAFWSGYRRATTHPRPRHIAERVRWWEPVTLLGSALWWLERWSRRADADAAGTIDHSAPNPQRYYLERALHRLDRFDEVADAVPDPRG